MDRNLHQSCNFSCYIGQARKSLWIETSCRAPIWATDFGQARKSLWIETIISCKCIKSRKVRLVRACGSKRVYQSRPHQAQYGQARKSLWIETVRSIGMTSGCAGQARKSLWIETSSIRLSRIFLAGQARKSLWIETFSLGSGLVTVWVRLVRACGSKQNSFKDLDTPSKVRLVRACGSKP